MRVLAVVLLIVGGGAPGAFAQDTREDLNLTVFTGVSVDSFAAKELRQYLNSEDQGEISEQLVAGFDFSYRLAGQQSSPWQIWLYGETIHGARSGDVDCRGDNADTDICKVATLQATNRGGALAIFRKAKSLEGFLGVRAEFLTLRNGSGSASKLYAKGQAGFLTVAGLGGDIVDLHHAAVGLTLTEGTFMDSYIEVGYGTNQLFTSHSRRWIVDAFLAIGNPESGIRPFAQMVIDADNGAGADSIQSFFGLDIDILKAWR